MAKERYLGMNHGGLPWVELDAQQVEQEENCSNCEPKGSQHCAGHSHVGRILLRSTERDIVGLGKVRNASKEVAYSCFSTL
jgi:cob(I)alamin adenosyltransferase